MFHHSIHRNKRKDPRRVPVIWIPSGHLDMVFPITLNILSAHSNRFSGTLPLSLVNRLTSEISKYSPSFQGLRFLSVGYNKLQGGIFECITNLAQL